MTSVAHDKTLRACCGGLVHREIRHMAKLILLIASLCLFRAGEQRCCTHLHEAAHVQHRVGQTDVLEILLSAVLDVHERYIAVLLTVLDGHEDVSLHSHRFRRLDQRLLALPVHVGDGLLRTRGGAVDDGVDAHQRRGDGLGLG